MDTRELAADFASMIAAGKFDEAAAKHWSPDIATYEAMPGDMSETHGIEQAQAKQAWWNENHDVHGMTSEGPYVNGDTFMMVLGIDTTPKGGERMQMREVVQYKVADGKIVEERYFY